MSSMREMRENETFELVVGSAPLVIMLFTTPGCGACEALRIKINRWLERRDSRPIAKKINLAAVHIPLHEHPELAQEGILSAPAVQAYAHGKLFYESAGYFSLDAFLQKVANLEHMMLED
jgi:thiol-disulfide isomerase/thioredoxin